MNKAAQMMLGSVGFKEITYITTASDATDLTTYTFSTQSIGDANSSRKVIVGVHGSINFQTVSTVTVGGISATILVQEATLGIVAAIAIAEVPTGTTADVVVTFTGAMDRCAIGIWRAVGSISMTPIDTGSSTADPGTDTLTSVIGGYCVCVGTGGDTATWTNATENYDALIESTTYKNGALAATAATTIAPSCNYATTVVQSTVFATF